MEDFQYAKNGTRVDYNDLCPEYVERCREDGIPDPTVQHNRMAAQQRSRRKKTINFNCNNLKRNVTVRDRLRNKLKYAEEIREKKQNEEDELAELRNKLRYAFSERDQPSQGVTGSQCSSHKGSTTPCTPHGT